MFLETQRLTILETERLRLAPLERGDVDLIYPLMGDAEVMAFWDIPPIDDPDLLDALVASQVAANAQGEANYWSLRTLGEREFIGCCDLSGIDRWHRRGEIGFLLRRDAWGQGYGLEAMQAVVAYAGAAGLRKLTARTHVGNRRSEQLLGKLGFTFEGRLHGHVERDGQRRDCNVFGLLL